MSDISVYFRHDVRQPNNVIEAWHGAQFLPRVGDVATISYDGGSKVWWRVVRVEIFNGGRSATCFVTDDRPPYVVCCLVAKRGAR